MDLLAVAVPVPLSSRGIKGDEDQKEENHRAAQRPCGSIPTAVASCSPPSFSSDDEDGGSSSSFCSSTSTLYSDDDEEERGEEEVGSPKGLICDNSPLSKMSDLMAQLPIKRGLSRHYDGKSQSYTSLASVTSVHDLPKPERGPARKKLKLCRSYGSAAGMADHVVGGGGGGCPGALKLRLPPPPPAAHPLKSAGAAAGMVGNKTGSSSSLQLPPTTTIGSERSGGFLRSTWRPPPAAPPQHRPVTFPATASHPQALLFA